MKKRILSLLIAIVMVMGMLPTGIFATDTDEGEYVYLSISFNANYIADKNGDLIVYRPIPLADIAAVDLTTYGLDNMLYDGDGDGVYDITALQLMIYAHEKLYGGSWSEVNFDAIPGSSYFAGGIFGFTENLVYFLNGDFPVDESMSTDGMTVGATSDRIVLKAGDFLDVASFTCYAFLWDIQGGFHLFADQSGSYVHDYTAEAGTALTVKLKHSFCDLMFGQSWVKDATDYEVYYGSTFGQAEGSVITDENGNANITFPDAGTYYVWCEGGIGSEESSMGMNPHISCDYYGANGTPCIVSSPAYAKVTVTGGDTPEAPSGQPQDVSAVLDATLAKLAATVTEPSFGTNAGEWTVFSLARGNYFAKDSRYFADYYTRILGSVLLNAEKVNKNGALDANKSTENSRLIMALSSIGIDSTAVGAYDLVEAYSANGINWIKKQGINGTIWTLIALDTGNYETSDPTIRQQCVDSILAARHNDGGWSLVTNKAQPSNVDITGMTLTALYPYRDQPEVLQACNEAIAWLSENQLDNGGFPYGTGETSESCAWAIVSLSMWGINPDTDPRFIKNGNSAVDNLLTYYLEDQAAFEHIRGAGYNAMATDQASYALVAYNRFVNGEKALYDMTDVEITRSDKQVTRVEGVAINVSEVTLVVGDKYYLEAIITPDNANVKDVTWKSADKKIAAIASNTGMITAKKEGTTTITVTTSDGGKTATCTVTVITADQAAANAVKELIAAIGEVTLDSETAITAALAAFDALTDDQKALVDTLDTLTAAEAKLAELKEAANQPDEPTLPDTPEAPVLPEIPESNTITVSMRLVGAELAAKDVDLDLEIYLPEYVTWMHTTYFVLDKGATVYDLWVAATEYAGIDSIGAARNYVETVYSPISGYELSEFTNGYRSGWMYTINGSHPGFGLCEQTLQDGDVVVWHYVNDYAWEVEDWSAIGGSGWPQHSTEGNNYWNRWLMAPDYYGGKGGGITGGDDSGNTGSDNTGSGNQGTVPGAGTVTPTENKTGFADVETGAYYVNAVEWAVENKITTGTSDNTFSPDDYCTRAQIITLLWRAFGSPEASSDNCAFTDVDKDAYYYDAVLWAVGKGITDGTSATTFSPDNVCTRAEIVTLLFRTTGFNKVIYDHGFEDVDSDAYYSTAVSWAAAFGITRGTTDTTFSPDALCTRAQAVTMLYRHIGR